MIPDPLLPKAAVHAGQGQLHRDAHVIPDPGGRGAGAASKPVDGDDIRSTPSDTAGDRGHVVDRGDLNDYRFLIAGGFL